MAPDPPFDYQQFQQEINNAVQRAVTTALANLQLPTGPPGNPGPQGPPGEATGSGLGSGSFERWNPSDLGYFDPHLDKSYGEGEIVTVGKDTYF